MRFQGAIFDLDGTLVDSLPSIAAAVNHGLTQLALPTHPVGAVSRMVGEGVRTLCERPLEGTKPELLEDLLRLVWSYYEAHLLDRTKPYAGIDTMIRELAHAGVRLGVLSNKPHDMTRRMVRAFWGEHTFRAVQGYVREEHRKPSPQHIFEMCSAVGIAPVETCLVGDTPTDVLTWRNACPAFPSV